MKPRAVIGPVLAMARPRLPIAEVDAVKAAAAQISAGRSTQCTARSIAKRVTADLLTFLDDDPVDAALSKLRALTDPSPFSVLARCPEINTYALFRDRRMARIAARECRQLGVEAWKAETRDVAAEVEDQLAGRYAKLLRSK